MRLLARRAVASVLLVCCAAALGYLVAALALDPRAAFEGQYPRPPRAAVEATLNELNLNDRTPIAERLATWAVGVLHGDLGRTLDGEPVTTELSRRVGVSLQLMLPGSLLGGLAGVAVGYLGAIRRHRFSDRAITLLSFAVLATPVFVLAVFLQIAAQRANALTGLSIFAWVGEYPAGSPTLLGRLQHLLLPTATIALIQLAAFGRYQRGLMLDVLRADYVRTARAKGLRYRTALRRHALRTALPPLVTFFAYNAGLLLLGATFTEKIYGWHGMGEWLIDSIIRGDVNAVAAYTLFASLLVLSTGLLAAIAQTLLDPRARSARSSLVARSLLPSPDREAA